MIVAAVDGYVRRGMSKPNRNELATTVNELKAIMPAATIGFRNPKCPMMGCKNTGAVPSLNTGYRIPAAIGISRIL